MSTDRSNASSHEEVSTRDLSHNTTRVLRDLETIEQPLLVTRHNRIIAALIPSTMIDVVSRWFEKDSSASRAVVQSLATPDSAYAASEMFVDLGQAQARSNRATPPSPPRVSEIGVRQLAQATSQILNAVTQGHALLIRRHAHLIAVLVPCSVADVLGGKLDHDPERAQSIREQVAQSLQKDEPVSRREFAEMVKAAQAARPPISGN